MPDHLLPLSASEGPYRIASSGRGRGKVVGLRHGAAALRVFKWAWEFRLVEGERRPVAESGRLRMSTLSAGASPSPTRAGLQAIVSTRYLRM
jgi:hypothetical protein